MKPLTTQSIGLELRTRVADCALEYTNVHVTYIALRRQFTHAYLHNTLPPAELADLHQRTLDAARDSNLARGLYEALCEELAEQFAA
jgi:hypothetical protein